MLAQLCRWSVCCRRVLLHARLAFLPRMEAAHARVSHVSLMSLPPPVGRRFLNRILGLPLARQNLLFNYFFLTLTAQIQTAKAEGKYSEGVSDLSGGKLVEVKEPQVASEAHTQWGTVLCVCSPERSFRSLRKGSASSVHFWGSTAYPRCNCQLLHRHDQQALPMP